MHIGPPRRGRRGARGGGSHAAGAALWELRASAATRVDVTVPGVGGRRRRPGLRIHRARDLTGQTTTHQGIPVTTPARTILDLAATLQRRPLERLLDQAENTRVTDVVSVAALARAHPGHRGASRLLAALDTHIPGTTGHRERAGEAVHRTLRHKRAAEATRGAWVEGLEVDCLFVEAKLVVETDGWRHHRTREQFERDRHRDATLTRAGYRVLRLTHRQLSAEPATAMATLRAAHRAAGARSL